MQGIPPQRLKKAAALLAMGDLAGARAIVGPIVERFPANAEARKLLAAAWYREGLAHARAGRYAAAFAPLQQAVAVAPDDAAIANDLGACVELAGDLTAALACYERACRLADLPLYLANLAKAQSRSGRYRAARETWLRLHAHPRATDRDRYALYAALQLPAIAQDEAEIDAVRAEVAAALAGLAARPLAIAHPEDGYAMPFFLSYHGRGNRELFVALAQILRRATPSLSFIAPHCTGYAGPHGPRLRVGFISAFLHNHSIGHTTRGFIAELDRRRFEVVTLRLPPFVHDELARTIDADSDRVVRVDGTLPEMRSTIAAQALDVLFFQDIGMEPWSYFLAFARLAPVQCVSFGHPDTTGIDTVDWFVSGELCERAEAAADYSERLHLVRRAGTLAYYEPPAAPEATDGAAAGTAAAPGVHRYLCAQTLFKVHPRMDALFGAILARDPAGEIVLIEATERQWTQALQSRLTRSLGALAGRVRFVARARHRAYLQLIASAHVSLDTVGFNGMNTSLEAFALDVPVVTLPTDLQRGRHTAGMYQRMGLERHVAATDDDYVDRAVRAGCDPAFRAAWAADIAANKAVLYRDAAVVRQFEDFFAAAVDAAARSAGLPPPPRA